MAKKLTETSAELEAKLKELKAAQAKELHDARLAVNRAKYAEKKAQEKAEAEQKRIEAEKREKARIDEALKLYAWAENFKFKINENDEITVLEYFRKFRKIGNQSK